MSFTLTPEQQQVLVGVAEAAGLRGLHARLVVDEMLRATPTPPNLDEAKRRVRGLARLRRQAQKRPR